MNKYHTHTLPKIENLVSKLKNLASELKLQEFAKVEGELFFEETYDSEEYNDIKDKKENLKKLLKEAEKLGIPKPCPYVGFIYFDGDKMSNWINGTHEKMPELEKILNPDIANRQEIKNQFNGLLDKVPPAGPYLQSAISSILLQFSVYVVRYIVETENIGKLVYSGGDDVVAIAPLSETLKIAERIRFAFSHPGVIIDYTNIKLEKDEYNNKTGIKDVYFSMGQNATGSAGIAIAHYHNALTNSLENARKAEKFAKNSLGRNACAIALLKRSGEHSIFGFNWYYRENNSEINVIKDLIDPIISLLNNQTLSNSFITQFYNEVDILWEMENRENIKPFEDRLNYLIKRHIPVSNKEKKGEIANCVLRKIMTLKNNSDKENFKNILSLISFISRYSKIIKQEEKCSSVK